MMSMRDDLLTELRREKRMQSGQFRIDDFLPTTSIGVARLFAEGPKKGPRLSRREVHSNVLEHVGAQHVLQHRTVGRLLARKRRCFVWIRRGGEVEVHVEQRVAYEVEVHWELGPPVLRPLHDGSHELAISHALRPVYLCPRGREGASAPRVVVHLKVDVSPQGLFRVLRVSFLSMDNEVGEARRAAHIVDVGSKTLACLGGRSERGRICHGRTPQHTVDNL